MLRTDFIRMMAALPFSVMAIKENTDPQNFVAEDKVGKMPMLFLGHGSPMNAIEENEFVRGFRNVAASLPKPRAILCISAHWETTGTRFTAMEKPPTIHDFGGFPEALFKLQYPAP